jgi:hypothetical protein
MNSLSLSLYHYITPGSTSKIPEEEVFFLLLFLLAIAGLFDYQIAVLMIDNSFLMTGFEPRSYTYV